MRQRQYPDWPDTEWYSYSGSGIFSHTIGGRCIIGRDYLSRPEPRSDPIGGSEPGSEA